MNRRLLLEFAGSLSARHTRRSSDFAEAACRTQLLIDGCAFLIHASSVAKAYECTATLGISLPSPPSAGVNTRCGSGHSTEGIDEGPYRPSRPFALSRSAFKTFSGVIGTSSILTPTAS